MNKIFHGAIIGFVVGGIAVLSMWTMYLSIANAVRNDGPQGWIMLAWVAGYTVLGGILGAILPKHKN